jgi:hypothetical protein
VTGAEPQEPLRAVSVIEDPLFHRVVASARHEYRRAVEKFSADEGEAIGQSNVLPVKR